MREAFALQKLLTFVSTKNIGIFEILTFEILTTRLRTTSLVLNNRAQTYCGTFMLNPKLWLQWSVSIIR